MYVFLKVKEVAIFGGDRMGWLACEMLIIISWFEF
jgi:hypothetical protein